MVVVVVVVVVASAIHSSQQQPPGTTTLMSTPVVDPFLPPRSVPSRAHNCTVTIVEHSSNTPDAPHRTWFFALFSHSQTCDIITSTKDSPRQKLQATTLGPEFDPCRPVLPGTVAARFLCAACCSDAGLIGGNDGADMGVGELAGKDSVAICGSSGSPYISGCISAEASSVDGLDDHVDDDDGG